MALIKCPECEQAISDKALKCPKCGYPIQEYLNSKAKEIQQTPIQKKSKKKFIIAALAVCVVAIGALGIVFASSLLTSKLTVEDISISKWRLTDSSDYRDYYEGTITSEQKKPFVAVIGEYEDDESAPQFVYVENGIGVIETYEYEDEDPSIKYRAIGYLGGKAVELSNIKVKYADSNYSDLSYFDYTTCDVLIDIDMNNSKTGLLVFDVVNETNNETERNMTAVVINGKTEYTYHAELPYKARGIDISIAPKLFCESTAIMQEDYVIEKEYTAEKDEDLNYYSGTETLAFADFADGFVLYTRET